MQHIVRSIHGRCNITHINSHQPQTTPSKHTKLHTTQTLRPKTQKPKTQNTKHNSLPRLRHPHIQQQQTNQTNIQQQKPQYNQNRQTKNRQISPCTQSFKHQTQTCSSTEHNHQNIRPHNIPI